MCNFYGFDCVVLSIQVRMDALGLLCETHRSTETVSKDEMDLIRHFLPFNLNSQAPGVRQQTVSMLKKVGTTLHKSLIVQWVY